MGAHYADPFPTFTSELCRFPKAVRLGRVLYLRPPGREPVPLLGHRRADAPGAGTLRMTAPARVWFNE